MYRVYLLKIYCLNLSFFFDVYLLIFLDETVPRHEVNENQIPDLVVEAGETIELICGAADSEGISWKYPQQTENEVG